MRGEVAVGGLTREMPHPAQSTIRTRHTPQPLIVPSQRVRFYAEKRNRFNVRRNWKVHVPKSSTGSCPERGFPGRKASPTVARHPPAPKDSVSLVSPGWRWKDPSSQAAMRRKNEAHGLRRGGWQRIKSAPKRRKSGPPKPIISGLFSLLTIPLPECRISKANKKRN